MTALLGCIPQRANKTPVVEAVPQSTHQGRTIRAVCNDWMPYAGPTGADRPGFAVEIFKEIFQRAGYEVDYASLPWKRCLEEMRTGKADAVLLISDLRRDQFSTSREPLIPSTWVVFARRDSPIQYAGPTSLDGLRIGVVDSYLYGHELDPALREADKEGRLLEVHGELAQERLARALVEDRADVVIENPLVMAYTVERLGLEPDVFRNVGTAYEQMHYVGFQKTPEGERLTQIFDEGIRRLRYDPVWEEILNRYGVENWVEPRADATQGTPATAP